MHSCFAWMLFPLAWIVDFTEENKRWNDVTFWTSALKGFQHRPNIVAYMQVLDLCSNTSKIGPILRKKIIGCKNYGKPILSPSSSPRIMSCTNNTFRETPEKHTYKNFWFADSYLAKNWKLSPSLRLAFYACGWLSVCIMYKNFFLKMLIVHADAFCAFSFGKAENLSWKPFLGPGCICTKSNCICFYHIRHEGVSFQNRPACWLWLQNSGWDRTQRSLQKLDEMRLSDEEIITSLIRHLKKLPSLMAVFCCYWWQSWKQKGGMIGNTTGGSVTGYNGGGDGDGGDSSG